MSGGGLQVFSVSLRPLLTYWDLVGVWGIRVWGQSLTIVLVLILNSHLIITKVVMSENSNI